MNDIGINRIRYRAWNGQRSSHLRRIYVISRKIIQQKLKSKGILAILILGIILVHVFPIIFGAMIPHEELTAETMVGRDGFMGGYLRSGLSILLILLLASILCSDLISQDLNDKSFVLYFSRPIKTLDYLVGKIGGAVGVISILTFMPLMVFCLVMIGTQTGSDYSGSLNVLFLTVIAGALTSIFFISYGIMISSLTTKKTYAGVGTFMSFFVLTIIGDIFTSFDLNWSLVSPSNLLFYAYDTLYGFELPSKINFNLFLTLLFTIIVIPLFVTYMQVFTREKSK